jgi:hypothetical protein
MKVFTLSIFLAAISFLAKAQTAIPDFKNKVMVLSKNNTLDNLESVTLGYITKNHMNGANGYLVTDNAESSYTYNQAVGNTFIVKIDPATDPEAIVTLYVFDQQKDTRRIKIAAVNGLGQKKVEIPTIKLNFKKVQDGVYIITTGMMDEGEYVFFVNQELNKAVSSDMKGFAFSVKKS